VFENSSLENSRTEKGPVENFLSLVQQGRNGNAGVQLYNVGVQWHVENADPNDPSAPGKPLPFTRGASLYKVDALTGKIVSGFDVPEPVIKSGSVSLAVLQTASGLIAQPTRAIAWVGWAIYCWLLFFSDSVPGVNALSLDPGTWAEVLHIHCTSQTHTHTRIYIYIYIHIYIYIYILFIHSSYTLSCI
jgi:hypothetical protein